MHLVREFHTENLSVLHMLHHLKPDMVVGFSLQAEHSQRTCSNFGRDARQRDVIIINMRCGKWNIRRKVIGLCLNEPICSTPPLPFSKCHTRGYVNGSQLKSEKLPWFVFTCMFLTVRGLKVKILHKQEYTTMAWTKWECLDQELRSYDESSIMYYLRWRKEWIYSERPITICAIVKGWTHARGHWYGISVRSRGNKNQSGLSHRLHYRVTCVETCSEHDFWAIRWG